MLSFPALVRGFRARTATPGLLQRTDPAPPRFTRPRNLEPAIRADLADKLVLLAGPRQVGKTTLARRILESQDEGVYLNWDNRDDRREIRAARWPGAEALVVLDELHKWRGWKGWLKGEFDKHRDHLRFLVTGSARLDVYRKGRDSLKGGTTTIDSIRSRWWRWRMEERSRWCRSRSASYRSRDARTRQRSTG